MVDIAKTWLNFVLQLTDTAKAWVLQVTNGVKAWEQGWERSASLESPYSGQYSRIPVISIVSEIFFLQSNFEVFVATLEQNHEKYSVKKHHSNMQTL